MVVGGTVTKAAQALSRALAENTSAAYAASDVSCRGGIFYAGGKPLAPFAAVAKRYLGERGPLAMFESYRHPPEIEWNEASYRGDAYPCYGWAATAVEVEVDLDTYEVSVIDMTTATDVGRAIHPVLAQGQVEGGSVQALGYALLEEHLWDRGRLLNTRMQNYLIPTALDVPRMQTVLLENPYAHGPYGAKGIGELPMDGPAPAVVAAVVHATGALVPDLPLSPDRVMRALEEAALPPTGGARRAEHPTEGSR
jgi:CO/xanthine dehydrogenase Mo-binding subunit